jgi:hypothetical protein
MHILKKSKYTEMAQLLQSDHFTLAERFALRPDNTSGALAEEPSKTSKQKSNILLFTKIVNDVSVISWKITVRKCSFIDSKH